MDLTELQRQRSQKRHPWEMVRLKIVKKFIPAYSFSNENILDIGSGDGYILKSLCDHNIGKHFIAVDSAFTPVVIEQLKKESSCEIQYQKDIPLSVDKPADVVLLLDVLEHCQDEQSILQYLQAPLVDKETVIIITVPAFQKLYSHHDKLLHHYRRYNVAQLTKLCKENNLEVMESGYFFSSLLMIRAIQLFLERLRITKPTKTIDNWNGNSFITSILCKLLWFDYKAGMILNKAGIKLPGLSAFCICRPMPL